LIDLVGLIDLITTGLNLTVANSSLAIAFVLICGYLGIAIVLLNKYATLLKLVGKLAKTTIRIFLNHEA